MSGFYILLLFPISFSGASVIATCQSYCDALPECAQDPHYHGSYCKSWQTPQVCFGLYHTSGGGMCFQPNNPQCPESSPVYCPEYSSPIVSEEAQQVLLSATESTQAPNAGETSSEATVVSSEEPTTTTTMSTETVGQ
jgi:hypothetical protein